MSNRDPYDNGLNLSFIMDNLEAVTFTEDVVSLTSVDFDEITGWKINLIEDSDIKLRGIQVPIPSRWVTKHLYIKSVSTDGIGLKLEPEDTQATDIERFALRNDSVNNMYVNSVAPIVYNPDIQRWLLLYERS